MSLDIEWKSGTRVRYSNPTNGYEPDQRLAGLLLNVDAIYTVTAVNVEDWSSSVVLREFPAVHFNSVLFEAV